MEGGGGQSPERSLTRFDEEANQSLVQVVCARLHGCMCASVSVSVSVSSLCLCLCLCLCLSLSVWNFCVSVLSPCTVLTLQTDKKILVLFWFGVGWMRCSAVEKLKIFRPLLLEGADWFGEAAPHDGLPHWNHSDGMCVCMCMYIHVYIYKYTYICLYISHDGLPCWNHSDSTCVCMYMYMHIDVYKFT